jgi:hypothetical protein
VSERHLLIFDFASVTLSSREEADIDFTFALVNIEADRITLIGTAVNSERYGLFRHQRVLSSNDERKPGSSPVVEYRDVNAPTGVLPRTCITTTI